MNNPYNPLNSINWSDWPNWQPIEVNGYRYYIIPGHPQFVFDPYTGRYYDNPTRLDNAIKAQQKADETGLEDSLLGAAGTIGGIYAANKIPNWLGFADEAASGAASLASGATAGSSLASNAASSSGALSAPQIISGTRIPGSAASSAGLGSTGALSTGLGALGTLGGAYGVYQGYKKGDPLSAGMGAAGMGLGLNAMGVALGPVGWAGLAALAIGSLLSKHESTRKHTAKNTKKLMTMGKDDQAWQNYVQGMREQYYKDPVDKSKPFAGKYASWDEYKTAGLEASDLTGVYGNLKTFGPEWAKLTQDQRTAVTQALINAGLYDSRKGEVIITDQNKAKEIYQSVLAKPVQNNKSTNTSTNHEINKDKKTIKPYIDMNKKPLQVPIQENNQPMALPQQTTKPVRVPDYQNIIRYLQNLSG